MQAKRKRRPDPEGPSRRGLLLQRLALWSRNQELYLASSSYRRRHRCGASGCQFARRSSAGGIKTVKPQTTPAYWPIKRSRTISAAATTHERKKSPPRPKPRAGAARPQLHRQSLERLAVGVKVPGRVRAQRAPRRAGAAPPCVTRWLHRQLGFEVGEGELLGSERALLQRQSHGLDATGDRSDRQ
jgi:hypothetical protein